MERNENRSANVVRILYIFNTNLFIEVWLCELSKFEFKNSYICLLNIFESLTKLKYIKFCVE